MKLIKNFFVILIFIISVSNTAFSNTIELNDEEKLWLKQNPNIKLSAALGHEPALFKDENGKVIGFLADYYEQLSKTIGQKIDFVYFSSGEENSLKISKQKGVYGGAMIFNSPELSNSFTFTNSYMQTPLIIFSSKNNTSNYSSKQDLVGKKLGVLRNNKTIVEYVENIKDAQIIYANSVKEHLELMQYEKVDVILGYSNYHYLINKYLFDNVRPAFNTKEYFYLSVGVNKEYPLLVSILNKAINKLDIKIKQEILSKWISRPENMSDLNLTEEEIKYLKENPVLRTINLQDYPPFNFNENGNAKGYTIDHVTLMAKKLGVKVEFIQGKTWNKYLQMLKDKEIDFIPHVANTKSRKEYLDFTNFKHITYDIGIAVKKEHTISDISELDNKVVAIHKNNFLHEHLKENFPKIKFLFIKNNLEALEAISSNRAFAAIGSIPALDYYIKKNWFTNIKTNTIENMKMDTTFYIPMGVAKGNDVLKSILEKVDSAIPLIEENKIKQKWIELKEDAIKESLLTKEEFDYLNRKKVIHMCIDPNWMPFEKNKNGKHVGMTADYIKILQKQINTPIVHIPTDTWTESLEFSKNRKCDILSLLMSTKQRSEYLNFTKPYLEVPLIIATSIEKFFINDISAILDKKIGIVKDYAFMEILKEKYPNINLIEVENTKVGLQKVRDNELFGFIGTLSTVGYAIQKDFIGELKIAGKFEDKWNLSVGVRNDEAILLDIFNKAISTISEKQHQTILNKWVSVNYQSGVDYSIVYQIVAIFVLIVVFILYKNQLMKNLNKKLLIANKENQEQQKMVDKYVLIITTDIKGVITDVNEAYCRHTGYKKEDLLGKKHNVMRHPDMSKKFFSKMWQKLNKNEVWQGEIKNFTKSDDICWLNTYIEPIIKDGEKIGYRSISEDITDKKRIEELSVTDKLTGLYNRLKLDEILTNRINEYNRYKTPFSIILLDVDNFKHINDNYGHDIGDYVLEEVAKRLTLNIRATDVVGRWGGEEFVVVCKKTEAQNGMIVAEHLRELIETIPFDTVGQKTISLGVTEFRDGDTMSSMFKRADQALYEAKKSGKNRTILS